MDATPHIGTFPHHFSGPLCPRTVGGISANAFGLDATPMHWHNFPLIVWAMWPRQVGENVCQCMGLHSAPCIGILCSLFLLGHMAQQSRGKLCQCARLHAAPRIGILSPYLSGPHGPEKVGDKSANARGCVQPHALAYFFPILVWAMKPRRVGTSMPMPGVACTVMHWHSFPLLVWAMWPRIIG